jgi:hypothetical protein
MLKETRKELLEKVSSTFVKDCTSTEERLEADSGSAFRVCINKNSRKY